MSPWQRVNSDLIAKAISELHFEEVLWPVGLSKNSYKVEFQSGAVYEFSGIKGAWGHLWVDSFSITRNGRTSITAAQFFIDSQIETAMSDITLANFLEELNNTLYSDLAMIDSGPSAIEELSGVALERYLKGHPKLLLNKGRVGWGVEDLEKFSPESSQPFQLRWALVNKKILTGSEVETPVAPFEITEGMMAIPIHPWQWDKFIRIQFQYEIHEGLIVDKGICGDYYLPQTSLRTLSNVTNPNLPDIKVPLTILNTSCVRGLPHQYLEFTPRLAEKLCELIQKDELLQKSNMSILSELSSWGVKNTHNHQVKNAPYRYHEQLGAVWRQSVGTHLDTGERAVLTAALFHVDDDQPLISSYVKKSGLSWDDWLSKYAEFVILPLLHLQSVYGIGLVAHGQNIILKMKDFVPSGVILKDFHGDLRLSSEHESLHIERFGSITAQLTKLPAAHLIHDLITGHFITVLRYISGRLALNGVLEEKNFYGPLSKVIQDYYSTYPVKNEKINILSPKFQKVLVNRVRFKIGYGDSSERPLPMLGKDLVNPLHIG